MIDFDTLRVGDRVRLTYGDTPWEVRIRDTESRRVYLARRNKSGKQIIETSWVELDEIAGFVTEEKVVSAAVAGNSIADEVTALLGEPTEILVKDNYTIAVKWVDSHGVSMFSAPWDPTWEVRLGIVTYDKAHPDGVIYQGDSMITMTVKRDDEAALAVAFSAIQQWLVER